MYARKLCLMLCLFAICVPQSGFAQVYAPPDRGQPGDRPIYQHLGRLASRLDEKYAGDTASLTEWEARKSRYREEFLDMLGLSPLPERTPLKATVTGSFAGKGFIVENLHYQSRPGLYVTANLYLPAGESAPISKIGGDGRRPAVLYVCGHSGRGRNGNKTAFQSHGMWFARHGYVCLVVDTLQLGEIAATHHGTYRENRWWWHSRGYTPAGVECWNGVRGIDYLVSRPDVDPKRIAVTGISGGGGATLWIAAADERVAAAVPVSGMADLESYIPNRVIDGHCDCMFLYNTYEWPWTRIAGLVAPRPLLFVNSDQDPLFPMDANERVINRLERLYSLYGAGDCVDALVSVGGHDYRQDIRQAAYRFINAHLQHDASPIEGSEVDLVQEKRGEPPVHPIEPERLRVFPTDADIPADQLNTTIDEHFVPLGQVAMPLPADFKDWQKSLKSRLRQSAFRTLPDRVSAARVVQEGPAGTFSVETEAGIVLPLERIAMPEARAAAGRVVLIVQAEDGGTPAVLEKFRQAGDTVYRLQPRGIGPARWTRKNPPNYVERSHVLLGRTVDGDRVRDVLAVAGLVRNWHRGVPLHLAGSGKAGILAACAALWDADIASVTLDNPPATHMDPAAPHFLNILRVADIPDVLGLLAPRSLAITGDAGRFERVAALYAAASARKDLTLAPAGPQSK